MVQFNTRSFASAMLSDNIAAISQRAGALLPYINDEIISKLIGWFELLGQLSRGFATLRITREDDGEAQISFGGLEYCAVRHVKWHKFGDHQRNECDGFEIANGNESGQRSAF